MNQEQINRKEMHDSTLLFMDSNTGKWSSIAKVGLFKSELSEVNTKIEMAMEAQADAQVFIGKNKTQLKHTIASKADILNDALEVMADLSGNIKLAQQMADSESSLFRLKNEVFISRIKLIVKKAEKHQEELINDFGVTEAQITDLKTDLDSFLGMNGLPRAYRVASDVATQDLKILFTETLDILTNKLDRVMKIFKRRDISFYNGYLAARTIIDN